MTARTLTLGASAAADETTWFAALSHACGAGPGAPVPRNLDALADFLGERTGLRKVVSPDLAHWPRERRILLCRVFLDAGVDLQLHRAPGEHL
ncbi:hypothetical protein [Corynebacterium pygosceleis]|uniref:Uncharacterized protein n=1 Tax=Corynebacterium pygosceleis TaxID=2800406 RepID=A0A9Q4C6A6_9CORY|nr:hypothetical protein [Corynebacterium pygosceleis]MCK7636552.1 hypothetical protein [Corynebacterium pygosceleis]MCK7675126.1 hypothetical protein [Corynebacterium pygosceleis]MCL0120672.1 hypothetical protein [Corynebacterium pygosceleis]MCX7444212.1 hypothetical protein [Corynebacterium pygosceleis]MCX7467305.1 hypothetical protein [Corynebacterium pygosceleis]